MRKVFCDALARLASEREDLVVLTGDLGFMALEGVKQSLGPRFINAGVAEQNMIGVAAGLAHVGRQPWCYSIAPFITARVYEQLRNDIGFHRMDVKIVGNGGGYGYGIMGPTHHAIDDLALMNSIPSFESFVPTFDSDVPEIMALMAKSKRPAYLRLGLAKPTTIEIPRFAPFRRLSRGTKVVLACLGPVVFNALDAVLSESRLRETVDLWCVSQFPAPLPAEFLSSVAEAQKLIVAEEHILNGGLSQFLSVELLKAGAAPRRFETLHAPRERLDTYGSQLYHQKLSGLDAAGLARAVGQALA